MTKLGKAEPTPNVIEVVESATRSGPRATVEETASLDGFSADQPPPEEELDRVLGGLGFELRDKLGLKGNLWILGDESLRSRIEELSRIGLRFEYRHPGSRGTGHRPAWLLQSN